MLVSMRGGFDTKFGTLIVVCGLPVVNALQNLALGKPTYQTDTGWNGPPNLAVDGNTDGDMYQGSCTHTVTRMNAWWEVDLGRLYAIDHVTVFSRTDCACSNWCCACCAVKLREVQLFVGVSHNAYVERGFHSGVVPGNYTFQLTSPVYGRWVKITRLPSVDGVEDHLTLCEVEVFGNEISTVRFDLSKGKIGTGVLLKTSEARTKTECCRHCKMTDKCVAVNYNSVTKVCEQLETVATIEDSSENIYFYRVI